MKKPITFEQASLENKARFVKALPYIADSRKPRTKPRSIEESIGISVATAEVVQKAFRSGRLIRKSPKGFVLNEFPSDELAGTADKVQPVEYGGRQAYFIGIEDIILNRVQEAKHWNYLDSAEWARTLMITHYENIDWSYCHKRAHEYDCADKFEEIQRSAKKIKKQIDEQKNNI